MDKKAERDWKYYGPGTRYGYVEGPDIPLGNNGHVGGILALYAWLPFPPGHINNVGSYDVSTKVLAVPGANQKRMHSSDQTLKPVLIETAKKAEAEGCRFIGSNCGYFGHFQNDVASEVNILCYLSSVIQSSWIAQGLRDDQSIIVICGDGPNLTKHLFDQCSVPDEVFRRCHVYGAQDKPVFSTFTELPGHFDYQVVKEEIVSIARQAVHDHPDAGAILLECTDMPPFAADIASELNMPVFDAFSMLGFAAGAVARKPYYGFK